MGHSEMYVCDKVRFMVYDTKTDDNNSVRNIVYLDEPMTSHHVIRRIYITCV